MTALEHLGAFVAHCAAPPRRLREILELHVADIVGARIASLATAEGAALLPWRTASDEGSAPGSIHRLRLDLATHCALARLSEVDDIHLASTTTPGAIVVPGALTIAAALQNRDCDALAAAMMAGYEVMVRFGQAIDGPISQGDAAGLWPLAALYGGVAVALFVLQYAQTYFLQQAGQRALADLRTRLFRQIIGQDQAFFGRHPTGELVTRLTSDIDALNQLLSTSVVTILTESVTLIAVVIVMFAVNWRTKGAATGDHRLRAEALDVSGAHQTSVRIVRVCKK